MCMHNYSAGASVFTDGRFGVTTSYSRFKNITCSDTASERALSDCKLHETSCLPMCKNIGIRCYSKNFGLFY